MYNSAARRFAAMLFLQRMRTPADRAHISQTFTDTWGLLLPNLEEQLVTVTPGSLTVGWASLARSSEGKIQDRRNLADTAMRLVFDMHSPVVSCSVERRPVFARWSLEPSKSV